MRAWLVVALAFALAGCVDRSFTPTVPDALGVGTARTIFAASTRAQEPNGNFGFNRSERLSLLELTVSIPPSHTPGELKFAYANPDPSEQFTMAGREEFESEAAFEARLRAELRALPPKEREITIFVHGFNATQAETAFRAAQLAHDVSLPGLVVIYSWPSRGRPLGYAYDIDSMLFARDGLESLLRIARDTGARRLILTAHSMGTALTMETLRQIELKQPGWSAQALGGVLLISPDIDVELFRTQIEELSPVPQPFVIVVSNKDFALNVSSLIRGGGSGTNRLGNLNDFDVIDDLPVEVIDTTAFSSDAGSSHLVLGTSPALLAMLNDLTSTNDTFDSERRTLENIITGNVVYTGGSTRIVLTPADAGPL